MSNLQTIKCQKCNRVVPSESSRTYHLSINNSVNRGTSSWLQDKNKVVLCLTCDNNRTTNLVQYLS